MDKWTHQYERIPVMLYLNEKAETDNIKDNAMYIW